MQMQSNLAPAGESFSAGSASNFDVVRATQMPSQGAHHRDIHFLELLSAYRSTGGIGAGSELAARRPMTGLSGLARAIASREVISFGWGGHVWLPMFQFEQRELEVRMPARALIGELVDALDDWEMADWFVEPNAWLKDKSPLSLMDTDYASVLDAARALRFAYRA